MKSVWPYYLLQGNFFPYLTPAARTIIYCVTTLFTQYCMIARVKCNIYFLLIAYPTLCVDAQLISL